MVITYHGGNSFKVQSGELTVLIDPENQRSFKGAAVIINTVRPTLTEPPAAPGAEEEHAVPFWVDHQGEYEVSGIAVHGWTTEWVRDEEHTAYRLTLDGIDLAVLGHLAKEPGPAVQAALAGADVLIVPAGGKPFLPVPAAAKLIRQIEPALVIPSLAEDMKPFLKEVGAQKTAPEEKLTLKRKDLVPKAMTLVWLTS